MKKVRRVLVAGLLLTIAFALFVEFYRYVPGSKRLVAKVRGRVSIEDRLKQYGSRARARLQPFFDEAGIKYPPQRMVLVGLKEEHQLQLYAANAGGPLKLIRAYPILGASGEIGPKLRKGDMQVPEGIYCIEALNPNSAFHLALRINYPNDLDRAQAARENRTDLGGNIMIHGSNTSAGCLAMGDEAAEELFCLAAEKWPWNIQFLLCPRDLRREKAPQFSNLPWTKPMYRELRTKLEELPN